MKTAIVIENKVVLVSPYTYIKIGVVVPEQNIQKMKEATKCRILSKEVINLSYNHNAGKVYLVTISVMFRNIEEYLISKPIVSDSSGCFGKTHYKVTNYATYVALLPETSWNLPYEDRHLKGDRVGIYAFGQCTYRPQMTTTYYTSIHGRTIKLNNNEITNNGAKRYVKNGRFWFSNKKY